MSLEVGPVGAIVLLATITYVTRIGGLVVMARTPISPRIEAFLEAISGSVLVALVLPTLLVGDAGARLAVLAAFTLMLRFGSAMGAMTSGVVATILYRAAFP